MGFSRSNRESWRMWERRVAGRCGRRAGKTSWAVATVHKASGGDWKFNFTPRVRAQPCSGGETGEAKGKQGAVIKTRLPSLGSHSILADAAAVLHYGYSTHF